MALFKKKTAPPPGDTEYIAAPAMFLDGGEDGIVAVINGRDGYPALEPFAADILGRCGTFRTLEAHAEAVCRGLGFDGAQYRAMVDTLKDLAGEGLLVAKDALPVWREAGAPAVIDNVVMYTRDRPDTVERGLRSYLRNCREHGRSPAFSLFDNSVDPAMRRRCLESLTSLKDEFGIGIGYFGLEEKNRLMENLVREGCDAETVRFAFFGVKEYSQNMNPALLFTSGSLFLSADDDTICVMSKSPGASDGTMFTSSDPAEFILYADRGELEKNIEPFDADVIALHERYLGRGISAYAAAASYGVISPALRRDLLAGRGNVRITSSGVMGDPGMGSTAYYLLSSGETARRLLESGAAYREISFSRHVMRFSSSAVITDARLLLGLHHAVDNRELLPPALPCFRNHDGLFISMVFGLSGGSYMAHLPWMVAHDPPLERVSSLEENLVSISRFRAADILTMILKNYWPSHPLADAAAGLRAVGSHLTAAGSLGADDFVEFIRPVLAAELASRIERLGHLRGTGRGMPSDMADDIGAYLRAMSAGMRDKGVVIPPDLDEGGGFDGTVAALKDLVKKFGVLVRDWPDIVDAMKVLKNAEKTEMNAV